MANAVSSPGRRVIRRRGTPSRTGRRTASLTLRAALAGVVIVFAAAGTAFAGGGTKGDPQPEMALFRVGAAAGHGSGAVLGTGALVLAAITDNSQDVQVCDLNPGARSCTDTVTLPAPSGDAFSGTPEVFAEGHYGVLVAVYDCCSAYDGVLMFLSTDQGMTFTGPAEAGNLSSVGAATYADAQVVLGTYENSALNVQAVPPGLPVAPVTSFATPRSGSDADTALATYNNGVLVASDDDTNTYVQYAPAGSNFNASSSYKNVGTFDNQTVSGISGNALLTDIGGSLTGGEDLRFFDGTGFGSAHKVPEPKNGDDAAFVLQEIGPVVHVFFLNRRHNYDIYSETTTDGVRWSGLSVYGTAITAGPLVPVLGPSGAGLVFETDTFGNGPLLAQPILNTQSVHIKISPAKIAPGHKAGITGTVSPRRKGQLVTLERLAKGLCYKVSTTHESTAGTFKFTVGSVARTYRAVVADQPGYYQYGYSNAVKLTVK